ncbi:MAG: IS605 OrfB-like transposable element containing RNAse H-like and Zn finger domain [Candidatus Methanohalarchaeum thermophilum]|uniref:IS605 OrfB-like transposable element containing RNAse H-like and Zn finger domain n=1 Tax=Methanohalarchaeum thermophilum TaxID=1903181 RepID=A0A1Q6DTH1_METT1|nr:MAG: IS605 OrfB-like transposable element containing RNAse H-like and Zn finger domain [Candidatus Methanohalarchaeum thermophilum]
MKEREEFFLNPTIELTSESYEPKSILGIDPSSRWLGVRSCGSNNKPLFVGKQIRTTRGKYQYLRSQTQKKGSYDKFSDKKANKVDYLIHKTTKWLSEYAKQNKLAIVVGDVKEINEESGKGRKFNHRVNTMPTHKLKRYLKYKCKERGVPFLLIDEAYTTQTCSNCGEKVGRPNSKEFKCP